MKLPPVLDPASGSRMFYFDKEDDRVLFGDIRSEQHVLCDGRALNINPDAIVDFRNLPFDDGAFKVSCLRPAAPCQDRTQVMAGSKIRTASRRHMARRPNCRVR